MNYRAVIQLLMFLIAAVGVSPTMPLAKEPPATSDSLSAILGDSLAVTGRVVYVDFWASWCQPCRKSFPFIDRLYQVHRDNGLVVVAVNLDKDSSAASTFLDKIHPSFPIVYNSSGDVAKRFNLKAIPSSFIYGRDGRLREIHRGFESADTTALAALVQNLLKEEPSK